MSSALVDLVLPAGCAGCHADARGLCVSCLRSFGDPFAHRPDPSPAGLPPLWVAARYEGPVRAAILAYKERARRDVAGILGRALALAVSQISWVRAPARLLLVPVPSRRRVARARGGDHVRRLAARAAAHLTAAGIHSSVLPVLRLATRPRDAAGLTASERAENVRGAFTLYHQIRVRLDTALVVVDDLVTTGHTMAEAARALQAAMLPVAAGAAVAATSRQRPATSRPATGAGPASEGLAGAAGASDSTNAAPEGAVRNASARLASVVAQGEEAVRQRCPGCRATSIAARPPPHHAATPPGTGWR